MTREARLYSLKRPTQYLWRTHFTRDQVLGQLEEMKISDDWLVCPLGEADKAITVASFVSNPDVFEGEDLAGTPKTDLQSSAPPSPAVTIERRHDLDALRAIAMLLGIALHGALAYFPMPTAVWPVHDIRQHEAFGLFTSAIHGFRLPLFFLISGFFTAMLWRKRGLASLLKHRFKRVFLPLAIGTFTIVPVVWIASIGASQASSQAVVTGANIFSAARAGDVEKMDALLAAGVAPNEIEPETGATPMSMAAWHGHDAAIELLIARGGDVSMRNRDGATPLHGAVMFRHAESVRVLIEHGADPKARNRNGETAADMLDVRGMRMLVTAGLAEVEVDPSSDKQAIALMLEQADQSLQSQTRPLPFEDNAAAAGGNQQDDEILSGVLWLMLTLFPIFHHLWFLWFLCWLVAAFSLYAKAADALKWKTPAWLVVSPLRYAWLIPLTILPQSMMGLLYPNFGPDTSTGLLPMPQILLYYAIFFFFGAMYFDCDDVAGRLGRWWPLTLPLALLVVFPIGYELSLGGLGLFGNGNGNGNELLDSGWCRPLAVTLQVAYAWLMTFGLMGLFRSLLARENKTMRYVSDSSYWLYLAHLPLIMVAQAIVWNWEIPALVKLILVCTVTSALLLASYQLFVRYTAIGTLLNGPRQRPQRAAAAVLVEPSGEEHVG